jgi:alpha-ketoglutarate-dependent taurine dioxygenase
MTPAIDVRPIAGAIGAEIPGIDLSHDLPAKIIGAIRNCHLRVMHRITFKGDRPR